MALRFYMAFTLIKIAMELSHPKTINIILKHNPGKIKIVQP